MASGAAQPVRVIHGQQTKLTRTGHGIVYDPARDEIFSSEAMAGAVIALPGNADGETAPLRVIQGPKTRIHQPWALAIDDVHHELMVADYGTSSILVFPIDANGDVAPIRVLAGPKTRMRQISGLGIDPQRNLIVASCGSVANPQTSQVGLYSSQFRANPYGGLFIFDRTANGDIPPRAIITGPHTGIEESGNLVVSNGRIFVAVGNGNYMPAYDRGGYGPRQGCVGPPRDPLMLGGDHPFIGVWKDTDHGDVAPRFAIHGAAASFAAVGGITVAPEAGEVFITDAVHNGVFGYLVPNFFTD